MEPTNNFDDTSVKSDYSPEFVLKSNLDQKRLSVTQRGGKLNALAERNKDPRYINKSIFHLLLDPFTLNNAYSNISKNKGSTTPGVDDKTISGFGRAETAIIIRRLKEGTYAPQPVLRVFVPKPGKSTLRPLGIPSISDRILQEAIRGILEAIYEPEFRKYYNDHPRVQNFGFRPRLGCWDAVEHFTRFGQRSTFVIEGDIKGAYDNVNFKILMGCLAKRIKDKKFLALVDSFLKAGIMQDGKYIHSLLGVPQGGIVSPLLFNIYMFEFDKFVNEEVVQKLSRYTLPTNKTPEYQRLLYRNKVNKAKAQEARFLFGAESIEYKESLLRLKESSRVLMKTPSKPQVSEAVFTRYADDWVLGIAGTLKETEDIKLKVSDWLNSHLKLSLSEEKTHVTNIRKNFVHFLGFRILLRSQYRFTKIMWVINRTKSGTTRSLRRTTSSKFFVAPDHERIFRKIRTSGFVKGADLYPIGKRPWAALDEFQIVQKYDSIMRGIVNFYFKCDTAYPLNRIDYILRYSCAKTLATRKKITVSQVFSLYGKDLTINKNIKSDSKGGFRTRTICFKGLKELRRLAVLRNPVLNTSFDPFKIRTFWRTTFKMYSFCVICGCQHNIEMHHIKSLKNIKNLPSKSKGSFNTILKQLNRKQVPVCKSCHVEITSGRYSGTSLKDLFSDSLAQL